MSVLQGIGNLFYNTVSGTSTLQDLASKVTELFLPMLQQEGELYPFSTIAFPTGVAVSGHCVCL